MRITPVSIDRASALVHQFKGVPVLVVGDVMVDRFIIGPVTRMSPEAPVPVVRFDHEYTRLGGAANVAHNLAALGAQVHLVGMVGVDAAAKRLRADLARAGIDDSGLVETPGRPTVEKVRVATTRNQQVLRIDYEDDTDAAGEVEHRLITMVHRLAGGVRALLVSDYLKGTVTPQVVAALVPHITPQRLLVVDPKIPHLASYAGASIVTPNHLEAETATHMRIRSEEDARVAATAFRERARCESVLITRGEHGMWLSSGDVEAAIPAVAREVADVTGAGDTVAATLALALAAGASLPEAADMANHAAGVVVGKFGPASVSPQELVGAIQSQRS